MISISNNICIINGEVVKLKIDTESPGSCSKCYYKSNGCIGENSGQPYCFILGAVHNGYLELISLSLILNSKLKYHVQKRHRKIN